MKKRNLKSLGLNTKSIANFSVKGGLNDLSGGSEQNPNSIDILKY